MKVGNKRSEGLRLTPIGELLKEREITQMQVARDTGINRQHLHSLVFGDVDPKGSTLIILADYFGVTTDYLLGRKHGSERDESTAL